MHLIWPVWSVVVGGGSQQTELVYDLSVKEQESSLWAPSEKVVAHSHAGADVIHQTKQKFEGIQEEKV